jgi:hypothetical protein
VPLNQNERETYSKLEARMDGLERKLDLLANNHLAHMQQSLNSILNALRLGSALLTVGLLAVLAYVWTL